MRSIGIQIDANEIILVVLNRDATGIITQTDGCVKFNIADHTISTQVQQFRDQVNSTFDLIAPTTIGVKMRNAKATATGKVRPPSPVSFKLEGIIQLYTKCPIEFVWSQTITAFKKKNGAIPASKNKYQQDAYDIAHYLLSK
ncbi:DUF3010 family protein [Pedobacter sp. JCM 36344]|uniref:DUF3010 family protein n=1 Tax=Pedobacter sp. JCM 36344 TaxID=3374280 RepID=UPI003979AD62